MFLLYKLVILGTAILGNIPNFHVQAIFDGIEARMGDVPWHVYFRFGENYHCAGVYTEVHFGEKTENVVLTSAACLAFLEIDTNNTLAPFLVHCCGETNIFIDSQANPEAPQRDARLTLIHPQFDPETLEHDIGIILLKRQWTISRDIFPIKMATAHDEDMDGGIVSGWGARGSVSQIGRHLRWKWSILADVEEYCMEQAQPPRVITKNNLCLPPLTNLTGVTTCKPDRGGPFAYYSLGDGWRLGGIISYQVGTACREQDRPTVLTRISAYSNWITSTVERYVNAGQ